ncbi:metal-dependent hydrolase [Halosolutus amylolyticus]|uniref:Metal-dependent hydrolase n=1 Tax=Halosolutus amylolyticus TaxID=2932267 RepID=A0ABD5PVZ5_9EURY|nr:metal-dependent hydrolase [Halosolutus amylolyticus]
MPDLLTHVLVGYVVGTLLSVRYESLRPAHVTLVMVGALSPDFVKIQLLLPDGLVAWLLGVPFSWSPLHTLAGTVLVAGLGSLLVAPAYRKQAIALFAIGALSHHLLDILLLTPTGVAYGVFWPFTDYRPPAGGLYLSSDRWPALVAGCGAVLVWAIDRRRTDPVMEPSAR